MKRFPRLVLNEGPMLLWMLAGCGVGVIGWSLVFRGSAPAPAQRGWERPRIQWIDEDASGPSQRYFWTIAELQDPSLLSLPSAHGFSRRAWEHDRAATRRDLDWQSDPSFLPPAPAPSLRSLLEPTPLPELLQKTVERTPAMSSEEGNDIGDPPWTANASVLRIGGDLATWPVLEAPTLGMITNDVPLRPTRLCVGVSEDGAIRYVSVLRTCGIESVDEAAMGWARQIRFEPQAREKNGLVSWGTVNFFWLTEPSVKN